MAVVSSQADFHHIREWYTRIAILERQVCLLEMDGRGIGTGFLIGPDIILIASHIIEHSISDKNEPIEERIQVRFDFAFSPDTGSVAEGTTFNFAENDCLLGFSEVDDLDVSVLRLAESAGLEKPEGCQIARGWVEMREASIETEPGQPLAIIQHPSAGPLKISVNSSAIEESTENGHHLFYRISTLPGSSGSPCFDMNWRLVALHQGTDFNRRNLNRGTTARAIIDWAKKLPNEQDFFRTSPTAPRYLYRDQDQHQRTDFPIDDDLKRAILTQGEGDRLELKERATKNTSESQISDRILRSVAAFMNSEGGGTVVIGISDDQKFVGIESEYPRVNPQVKNWDGFQIWLNDKLNSGLDVAAAFNNYTIIRYNEKGKDICAIRVQPSDAPVFVGSNRAFYVRTGAQNKPQTGHDLFVYFKKRWG